VNDDDELRARLRHADPAASLAPLAPDRVSQLLEQTMNDTTTATRRRIPALAAAAVLLVAAGFTWALTRPDPEGPNPGAPIAARSADGAGEGAASGTGTGTKGTQGPGSAVELSVGDGIAAKCAEPRPEHLTTGTDFVFAGTVAAITGDRVTLKVTHVYKGPPGATTAHVTQTGDSSETMLGSGRFETGADYLVASSGGRVMICGYSGEAGTPGLRALYDEAF
jgi:hypothetical protein